MSLYLPGQAVLWNQKGRKEDVVAELVIQSPVIIFMDAETKLGHQSVCGQRNFLVLGQQIFWFVFKFNNSSYDLLLSSFKNRFQCEILRVVIVSKLSIDCYSIRLTF